MPYYFGDLERDPNLENGADGSGFRTRSFQFNVWVCRKKGTLSNVDAQKKIANRAPTDSLSCIFIPSKKLQSLLCPCKDERCASQGSNDWLVCPNSLGFALQGSSTRIGLPGPWSGQFGALNPKP